jgi:hypothetical protein
VAAGLPDNDDDAGATTTSRCENFMLDCHTMCYYVICSCYSETVGGSVNSVVQQVLLTLVLHMNSAGQAELRLLHATSRASTLSQLLCLPPYINTHTTHIAFCMPQQHCLAALLGACYV